VGGSVIADLDFFWYVFIATNTDGCCHDCLGIGTFGLDDALDCKRRRRDVVFGV
jgi:hypothetical protein